MLQREVSVRSRSLEEQDVSNPVGFAERHRSGQEHIKLLV